MVMILEKEELKKVIFSVGSLDRLPQTIEHRASRQSPAKASRPGVRAEKLERPRQVAMSSPSTLKIARLVLHERILVICGSQGRIGYRARSHEPPLKSHNSHSSCYTT